MDNLSKDLHISASWRIIYQKQKHNFCKQKASIKLGKSEHTYSGKSFPDIFWNEIR